MRSDNDKFCFNLQIGTAPPPSESVNSADSARRLVMARSEVDGSIPLSDFVFEVKRDKWRQSESVGTLKTLGETCLQLNSDGLN